MCAKKLPLKQLVRWRSRCLHEIADIDYELSVTRDLQKRALREGRKGIASSHRKDIVALEDKKKRLDREVDRINRDIKSLARKPRRGRIKQPSGYLRKKCRPW